MLSHPLPGFAGEAAAVPAQKVILRAELMLQRLHPSSCQVDIDAVAMLKAAQALRAAGKEMNSIEMERAAYDSSQHLTELRYGYTLGG